MTHDQITHHLDRWQRVMRDMDEKMSALYALTGYTDGPLSHAIGELQEEYTRLLAEHLDWDSDALQDWWLEHEFGANPMQAGFEGEGMREIRDSADLARFIHDDKARSSGMTECAQLRAAIRRLCNIYVVDDYYMGQLREERLEAAVNRAIDQVKEITK